VRSPLLDAALRAPRVTAEELAGEGDVLVLVPHPDDETLGCGAAIAALAAAGRRVQVVLVTDGAASHPRSRRCAPPRLAALRARELREALRILGDARLPPPLHLGYPDGGALKDPATLLGALARLRPFVKQSLGAIWASWEGDPHCDHVNTARLAKRLAREASPVPLWFYPIWGRFACTDDVPVGMVRLDAHEDFTARKRRALDAHRSQMTRLICDDPDGFTMRPEHQAHFLDCAELFIPEIAR